jgi:hypothetical protein
MFFELSDIGLIIMLLPLAVGTFWFVCCQTHLLNLIFHKLYLPCSIRVHRTRGFDGDDDNVQTYSQSAHNPYRFNVDQNIDGNIIKCHGRF